MLTKRTLYEVTLVGNAQKFWVFLLSQTDTRNKLDQKPTVDGILAIVAYALGGELCGFSLYKKNIKENSF